MGCGKSSARLPVVKIEEITYGENSNYKGIFAYTVRKGKLPGVIIIHSAFGQGEYTQKRAVQLAELGYVGFAIDMFGKDKNHCTLQDAMVTIEEQYKNMESTLALLQLAYDLLKNHERCDGRIAAIGYCYSGTIVLSAARAGFDLRGVACFHGGLTPYSQGEKGKFKGKVLVCNGAIDPSVKPESIDAFKKEFEDLGIEYKFINYADAKHGFTEPGATQKGIEMGMTAMLEYNEKADKDSWADFLTFLKSIF